MRTDLRWVKVLTERDRQHGFRRAKGRQRLMRVAILLLLLTVLFCPIGRREVGIANEAPITSVGKSIRPRRDVPVRMVSENVTITIDNNVADVTCSFLLVNEGPAGTIEVGFPRGWEGELHDFRAWISDAQSGHIPLPVESGASEPVYDGTGHVTTWWKTFKVPFDSMGPTQTVRNYYWTRLRPAGHGFDDLRFTYILRTGALWAGKISDAKITVVLRNTAPDQVTKASPEGYTREGQRMVWHFKDIEPTEDIKLWIMQDFLYDRLVTSTRILNEDSHNAEAHFLLGTVYFNQEGVRSEQAEQELLKAISLNPRLWDARWYLSTIYEFRGNWDGVVTELGAIVRDNPTYRCSDKAFHPILYADILDDRANPRLRYARQHVKNSPK